MSSSTLSPVRDVPATARGRRTRERLLEAAESVFGSVGYEAASVAEITRRAGVGQGTLYLYFPDKRAIFVALVDDLSHRLRSALATAVDAALATGGGRLAVEDAGFRAFFGFVTNHRDLYRIVRQAEFVDPPTYRGYYERLAGAYARGLERAMAEGEVRRSDPEALAYALMGIADFVGMRWVLWEDRPPPDEVVDGLMGFIRQGMEREREEGGRR